MTAYLFDLALRLAEGMELLPEDVLAKHTRFLLNQQRDDGGFAGRDGDCDAYYTSFALRAIALVGRLEGEVAERAAAYVARELDQVTGSVDFLSAVLGAAQLETATGCELITDREQAWKDRIATTWSNLRRDDGGFAKTQESGSSSTYHTFLIVLAAQLLEIPLENTDRIVEFVLSRRRDDGGFVEIAPMRRSGTNPTAAAVALLSIYEASGDALRQATSVFLRDLQSQEGGFTANTRIPVADLLSTFTGLLTLTNVTDRAELATLIDVPAMRSYVVALEQSAGGFIGGVWDDEADVEYTFYGLGSLALLAAIIHRQS